MSIVSELERLQSTKDQLINLLDFRGVTLPNNVKTEDMPALIGSILRIEKPYYENLQTGWVNSSSSYGASSTWTYQTPQGSMSDVYKLKVNHKYLSFVCIPGTRFRVMRCTTDPVGYTSNISGTSIARIDSPHAGSTWTTDQTPNTVFIPDSDCFLIIQKDNEYNSAIRTYVFDMTYMDNPGAPVFETDINLKHVGGKIFYIDSNSDRQIKFYDSSKQEIQNVAVGDSPAYYEVLDEGSTGYDKYYIYDDTTGRVEKCWGYYDVTVSNANGRGIRRGKINTRNIMSVEDTSQYVKNSIWTYLKNKQNHGLGLNRCNDWYVGSVDEINALRNSNLEPTWFDNDYMWSSTNNTGNSAWMFDSEEQDYWRGWTKQSNSGHHVCFIRSF